MLEGVEVELNPLLSWSDGAELPIIYDDKDLVVVNKPEVMLSVPGMISRFRFDANQSPHPELQVAFSCTD